MEAYGLNQRKIIKGCCLGTQVGGRFMLAAKLIILFPKPGNLSCCYHLQRLLASFINTLLVHVFIHQTFISSSYVLAASQGAGGGGNRVNSQMGLLYGGAERKRDKFQSTFSG